MNDFCSTYGKLKISKHNKVNQTPKGLANFKLAKSCLATSIRDFKTLLKTFSKLTNHMTYAIKQ